MVAGQQAWRALSALPTWQVTQVPRAPQRQDEAHHDGACDDGAAQRAAELVSAYWRGAPVAVAWVRAGRRPGAGDHRRPGPGRGQ